MSLSIIILAGGTGTRMNSKVPKVLHQLAKKPLLQHVVDTVSALPAEQVFIVYGHMGEDVRNAMAHCDVTWVEQKERLGTGHAVTQVLPRLNTNNQVLILYGDVPLISQETLVHLVESTADGQLGLLTAMVDDPTGLGRIVRDEYRQVSSIVEEKDATEVQRQIKEINTGIYCVDGKHLADWLPKLSSDNAQKEYYLTDIVKLAREDHIGINVSKPRAVEEIYGANNRVELAKLESIYQSWQAEALMAEGVSICDPSRVDIRGTVHPAPDAWVDINVVFEGEVTLGEDCVIEPHCVLKNVKLGPGAHILAHSVLEDCVIMAGAQVGPFARIRPGSVIESDAKVGNFVEVKNTVLGKASKVNHLSYIGDAEVGAQVNIGAGVITCNYDGANKHKTVIKDSAFIGSDVQLVAPVTVGANATIGAGTTLTKDAPDGQLTVSRAKQQTIEGWERPKKKIKSVASDNAHKQEVEICVE